MNKINLYNVSKYYIDKKKNIAIRAISSLTCSFNENEITTIVGQSGCGKSTLLKLIAGLYKPDEGEINYSSESLNDKSSISYMSQEFALYPHMSVYENIAYPLTISHTPKDEIRKKIIELSKDIGIDSLLTRRINELSIGQAQRVALCRALIKNPEVLLLDEPLSNVDPSIRISFLSELKTIKVRYNLTIIYVTHSLSELSILDSNVCVMDNGSVVEQGHWTDLVNNKESFLYKNFISINNHE